MFNQEIYLGKNLAVTVAYFCYGHASLKRERIFYWIAIFATTKTIFISIKKKLKVTEEYRKSYKLIRRSKENKQFLSNFFLKNNNEANKQEQNISLNPKKNLLDTLHGKTFKAKRD